MSELQVIQFDAPRHYQPIWEAMCRYTRERTPTCSDQLWILQHTPVFTLGQAGKEEHVLNPQSIPVVRCDRGGQVTYHGPGQLMLYTLLDLNRLELNTRTFVRQLEQWIITYLSTQKIKAYADEKAPGVYINGAKICSIGLRVRAGFCYHGIAFNVNMDLSPFSLINPCGYKNLAMTQLIDHTPCSLDTVASGLLDVFSQQFGFDRLIPIEPFEEL